MATSPMMADPSADPSANPASTEDTDMSQGFVIEIKCMPNGMFSVCTEPLEEEMEEEGDTGAAGTAGTTGTAGGEPPEPPEAANDETPAKSFIDAVKIAIQMYKQSSAAQPDDQMSAGYSEG